MINNSKLFFLSNNLYKPSLLNQLIKFRQNKIKKFSSINSNLHMKNNIITGLKYYASNHNQQQFLKSLVIPKYGFLSIRNSDTLELSFETKKGKDHILIGKNSTVGQLSQQLFTKLEANNIKMMCNQGLRISQMTPIDALTNRLFFIVINEIYSFKVQGQLLRPVIQSQISQPLRNLQLPLFIRRQIEHYCDRVNIWIESKYGIGLQNTSIKITKAQAKKILINAALDPNESTKRISEIEQEFQKIYWQVQQMYDKKSQAAILCSKMVRNRMSLGLLFILANIIFIWSGTYIFYSWDIIEPIAYFISSLAGIILFSRFFKIRRPFSLINYKSYMINKYMLAASKRVGFVQQDLLKKQRILIQLQSELKDYYLKKL